MFPDLRDSHEGQHTGANLHPCTWPGCKQELSSKDALRQHIDTHTDERHPCEECDKTFNTILNLKQHMKGAHGDGFIALCGASFDWSNPRNEHQKDCDEYIKIKELKDCLPVNLVKGKQWKKSLAKDQSKPFMWIRQLENYICKAIFPKDRCIFPFV